MKESIPGLMNAVKMIFSISSYYNTPEQLTYLFAKVSVPFLKRMLFKSEQNYILYVNFKRHTYKELNVIA